MTQKFDIYAGASCSRKELREQIVENIRGFLGACQSTDHPHHRCPITAKGADDWTPVYKRLSAIQITCTQLSGIILETYVVNGRTGLPDEWFDENTEESWKDLLAQHFSFQVIITRHLINIQEMKTPPSAIKYLEILGDQVLEDFDGNADKTLLQKIKALLP